jgi:hypothetical protein
MDPAKGALVTGNGVDEGINVTPRGEITISHTANDMTLTLVQENIMEQQELGFTEMVEFHTSCSTPLILGERYGSLKRVALNKQSSGMDVVYQYVVTNNGLPLDDILVVDDLLGNVSENKMFTLTAQIQTTMTNMQEPLVISNLPMLAMGLAVQLFLCNPCHVTQPQLLKEPRVVSFVQVHVASVMTRLLS